MPLYIYDHVRLWFFCLHFLGGNSAIRDNQYIAEFCKSSIIGRTEETIELKGMDKVLHGVIHMPRSYGNRSEARSCMVTIRGLKDAVIVFSHKRRNTTNGPCLRQNATARSSLVIDNEVHEGPCSEQRMDFRSITDITLKEDKQMQPGFTIFFTGKLWILYYALWLCLIRSRQNYRF